MCAAFLGQVLAQIKMWTRNGKYENKVLVLPEHLDEEVAVAPRQARRPADPAQRCASQLSQPAAIGPLQTRALSVLIRGPPVRGEAPAAGLPRGIGADVVGPVGFCKIPAGAKT